MITSINNAEHYIWGNACDGWHLLKTDSLSVIQERMPASTVKQKHFHNRAQQLFYILAGTATFDVEGKTFIATANESIHIPKGTKHSISNNNDQELSFLVISEPKAHDDRENV